MRRLSAVLLGALILPVGLMPVSAFATDESVVEPTPSVTVAAPPSSAPATTSAPTPTATGSTSPADPGGSYGDPDSGVFTLKPLHGPAGSTVTATSKTKCVDPKGKVSDQAEFVMINEADLESEDEPSDLIDKVIDVDATGAWTATAKVPAKAKAGDLYFVIAACFAPGTKIDDDSEPFLVYEPQEFTVTGADKAPLASPVAGDPHFTG